MPSPSPAVPTLEYEMPCAEALLAGTLACMTAHAQSRCEGHRRLMAQKVAENLSTLVAHPVLSTHFRAAMAKLADQWHQGESTAAQRPAAAIHLPSGRVH